MSTPEPTTVMDHCATLLRSASITGLQLATYMGEALPASPAPAEKRPLRIDEALGYAGRPCGVTVRELCALMGIGYATAYTYISRLHAEGRLTAIAQHRSHVMRWFADPAMAAAWVPEPEPAPAPKPRKQGKPGAQLVARQVGTISPAAAPVKARGGEVVIPEGLVIQRIPAPPGRYEVRPGEDVVGAGFSAEWRRRRGEAAA